MGARRAARTTVCLRLSLAASEPVEPGQCFHHARRAISFTKTLGRKKRSSAASYIRAAGRQRVGARPLELQLTLPPDFSASAHCVFASG
jgi:hypothetical protein